MKNNVFKLNIQKKLIFVIGSLLVITNLIVGIISYNTAKSEIEKAGKINMINTVNMIKQIIELENSQVLSGTKTLERAQTDVKEYILGKMDENGERPINKNILLGNLGYVFILDKEGNEIAHPYIEGVNVWNAKDMKTGKQLIAREVISKAYSGGGFTRFYWTLPYSEKIGGKLAFSNIDPYWGWIIVAAEYEEDLNKGSLVIIKVISNLLVFVFLYTSIAVILFSSHISEPIEHITNAIKKVANGDLNIEPLKIKNHDETGDLNNSFELMLFNLKNEIDKRKTVQIELETLNESLEKTVKNRTIDLKKNNSELLLTNKELENAINELKQMQNQLIESEKMAALGNLVAGIAHEMNTPLGVAVTTFSHLDKESKLLEKSYKNNKLKKSDMTNYFSIFSEASEILMYNINRAVMLIQSFKRIAVDQNTEEKMSFNIYEYLNTILLSLKHEYKRRKIEFIINCDEELTINSVPGAFSHIFTNFIMNSIVHGFKDRQGGIINIDIKEEKNILKIEYSDNGSGIEKENLKKVFEPFFTTNRGNGGSGLGLNIVYSIVTQQLKGTIVVESKKSIGTKFIVRVPIKS
ncbi:cache domain-containing protein [Helicovermis profundi]|uniref:histidine kinase n=1 Tax=Helicovermis profundi TaxID=3065157 RepID=A0AAU9E0C4_9FIRM|nr:hypothetical protein HLPR_03070 [Clostridia bacterium S502]